MKRFISIVGLVLCFCTRTSAADSEFAECKVSKTTKIRISGKTVKEGSIAVTRTGEKVGIPGILSDVMIYFQSPDGRISETYQWMYNKINKVENREDKYLVTSFGEDVIITLGSLDNQEGQKTVKYTGTKSGNYLTLICE
jgi:hypothetical protein